MMTPDPFSVTCPYCRAAPKQPCADVPEWTAFSAAAASYHQYTTKTHAERIARAQPPKIPPPKRRNNPFTMDRGY